MRREGPSAAAKMRVMKRDRFRCTYCGTPGTETELEVDHIVPVAKGGSHHLANLTTACRHCNQAKGAGNAPERAHAPQSGNGGIVGMFLHTLKNGQVEYQGEIIGAEGDFYLVQLFSWLHGGPTNVVPIAKARVLSNQCRLYATHDDWRYAVEYGPLRLNHATHY